MSVSPKDAQCVFWWEMLNVIKTMCLYNQTSSGWSLVLWLTQIENRRMWIRINRLWNKRFLVDGESLLLAEDDFERLLASGHRHKPFELSNCFTKFSPSFLSFWCWFRCWTPIEEGFHHRHRQSHLTPTHDDTHTDNLSSPAVFSHPNSLLIYDIQRVCKRSKSVCQTLTLSIHQIKSYKHMELDLHFLYRFYKKHNSRHIFRALRQY